jgi:hypothetical protein
MDQLLLSHSGRQTFQQCHKKFYWTTLERLEPGKEPAPFKRGRLGHALVDEWLRDKSRAVELVERAEQETEFALRDALREYFIKNAEEPIKYKKGISAFKIPLGTIISTSGRLKMPTFFVGELDGYVEYDGKEWVIERKFTTQIPSDLVGRFQLDDQVRGYTWAARRQGLHPVGALVDIVRCTKNPALVRDFVVLDESELNRFHDELLQVAQEIVDSIDQNRWPLSPHSCFNWGTCPYRLLCLNPDRAAMAEGMGYVRKEKLHEEEVIARIK